MLDRGPIQFNSAFTFSTNFSIATGFLMKHPMLKDGYCSLNALVFISVAVIKQTLTLISCSSIFVENSKPSIFGILMSTSKRSYKFGLNSDSASKGSL